MRFYKSWWKFYNRLLMKNWMIPIWMMRMMNRISMTMKTTASGMSLFIRNWIDKKGLFDSPLFYADLVLVCNQEECLGLSLISKKLLSI